MSYYRLNFLDALAAAPVVTQAPRRTVRYGSESDMMEAREDRMRRIYLVLLTEDNVPYCVDRDGTIRMEGEKASDMDRMAALWSQAMILINTGRDLQ